MDTPNNPVNLTQVLGTYLLLAPCLMRPMNQQPRGEFQRVCRLATNRTERSPRKCSESCTPGVGRQKNNPLLTPTAGGLHSFLLPSLRRQQVSVTDSLG